MERREREISGYVDNYEKKNCSKIQETPKKA